MTAMTPFPDWHDPDPGDATDYDPDGEIDDRDAYDRDDPKNPGYADSLAWLWDGREGK